jgi:short-subunit dehydrogenase
VKELAGKTALVTGAASGIGRAIAEQLAQEGVDLYLLDIDALNLRAAAKETRRLGAHVVARQCDLTDRDELAARLDEILDDGGVDIVVNNAGLAYHGQTSSMSAGQWDAILGVNLLAPVEIIRRLLPSLEARGEAHIVNIASLAGLVGFRKSAAYSLTKYALVGLGESLRSELAGRGIGVSTICPGFVRTQIFERSMNAKGRLGVRRPPRWLCASPEAVARRTVNAIRRNRRMVLVTPLARIAWWLQRLAPGLITALASGGRRPRKLEAGDRRFPLPAISEADGTSDGAASAHTEPIKLRLYREPESDLATPALPVVPDRKAA